MLSIRKKLPAAGGFPRLLPTDQLGLDHRSFQEALRTVSSAEAKFQRSQNDRKSQNISQNILVDRKMNPKEYVDIVYLNIFLNMKNLKNCLEGIQQLGASMQGVLVVEGGCQDAAQAPIQVALRIEPICKVWMHVFPTSCNTMNTKCNKIELTSYIVITIVVTYNNIRQKMPFKCILKNWIYWPTISYCTQKRKGHDLFYMPSFRPSHEW